MIRSLGIDGFFNRMVKDSQFSGVALVTGKYGVLLNGEYGAPSKIDTSATQVRAELTNTLFSESLEK